MKNAVFLDTHILIWLADGQVSKLSRTAMPTMAKSSLWYSPIVRLEIEYLHEIGRNKYSSDIVLKKVADNIEIIPSTTSFNDVCRAASAIGWTRDTFDRLIVAEAAFHKVPLITADQKILQHYPLAVW